MVVPDGCRDLLFRAQAGKRPRWHITFLDETAYEVNSAAGDFMMGYRLRPGTLIDEIGLLGAVKQFEAGQGQVEELLEEFCCHSDRTEQALSCLSAGSPDMNEVAKDLGMSVRSLQRLVQKNTGKTPGFWMGLARVRRAARQVTKGFSLAQIAIDLGYADQSHMSRDMKRWLGASPGKIKTFPQIVEQLQQPGYD